ncbi:MAG: hypothetical protein JW841_04105 [Deltaproteobacteria bacterium]|nr:hypothetical protein [Deltaproteobacteria bacterium]
MNDLNSSSTSNQPSAPPSRFVTTLAWIFIALSGFATFISLVQNITIHFFIAKSYLLQMQYVSSVIELPTVFIWLMQHLELWTSSFLAICILMLISSIGILRRYNWARLMFISLLALGILLQLLMLPIHWSMLGQIAAIDHPQADLFKQIILVIKIFIILLVVGYCTLFGWIIKKLISPAIKAEFKLT